MRLTCSSQGQCTASVVIRSPPCALVAIPALETRAKHSNRQLDLLDRYVATLVKRLAAITSAIRSVTRMKSAARSPCRGEDKRHRPPSAPRTSSGGVAELSAGRRYPCRVALALGETSRNAALDTFSGPVPVDGFVEPPQSRQPEAPGAPYFPQRPRQESTSGVRSPARWTEYSGGDERPAWPASSCLPRAEAPPARIDLWCTESSSLDGVQRRR